MPRRKFGQRPPRLKRIFQEQCTPVWFVTFNTAKRTPWLACSAVHEVFIQFAKKAHAEHDVAVGRYVIMPDHIHLFVSGYELDLGRWVGMLKQVLARAGAAQVGPRGRGYSAQHRANDAVATLPCGVTEGRDCNASRKPAWQEGFFDHLLRSEESYAGKWEYVRDNPVRAGLVARWEQWPWQGEIVEIDRV